MTKLLINEPPLQVLPTLAKKIGLNEAIFIQQLHYWLGNSKMGREIEGRHWIRNTVTDWQKDNFPFWSERTIARLIANLVDRGLLLARNDLNAHKYDRTKWYTINYDILNEIPFTENDISNMTSWQDGTGQDGRMEDDEESGTIPETTSETTSEKEPPPAKMSADYLDDVFNRQGQVSESTAEYPEDQFWVFRDSFLQAFQQRMQRLPNQTEKEEVITLTQDPLANYSIWDTSLKQCILNWTGKGTPPVSRIIEVYKLGGDYEKWRRWKYDFDHTMPDESPEERPGFTIIDKATGKIL